VISVCLASRDGIAFVEGQILSILAQLGPDDELLIGDDGSVDGTLEFLAGIEDPRVKVRTGPFGGAVANFDALLARAGGEWIVLSDQDDLWLPGRIDALREVPGHAMVALCDAEVVDAQGRLLASSLLEAHRAGHGVVRNLLHNAYTGCCLALRREFLPQVHPFPAGIGMHDWWIGLRAEQEGCAHWIRRALVRHLRHGNNASSGTGPSRLGLGRKLSMRLRLAGLLLVRLRLRAGRAVSNVL
jgi:glycosyltransferase involved in cell wall biosynthesis